MSLNNTELIKEIQDFLIQEKLDGWLLYDFGGANKAALKIVAPKGLLTRRWFVLIPAKGQIKLLHHKIEERPFSHLNCERESFVGWRNLEDRLKNMLSGMKRIAMEYSPKCAIPTVSRVDAGMLEWIRSFGPEIVSSADLIQLFEARWSERSLELHARATEHIMRIMREAADFVRSNLEAGMTITEYDVQQRMWRELTAAKLETNGPPIVAVKEHTGDPHYQPEKATAFIIDKDDVLLLDCWCKVGGDPDAVYSDITWMYYTGTSVPKEAASDFKAVCEARDKTVEFIKERVKNGMPVHGYEADDIARSVLKDKGLDKYFIHRTGHSIDAEDHGSGANLDNLETKDERKLIPRTAFSVEPGIYKDSHGVRTEINVYIDSAEAKVITPVQKEIECLFD